MCCVLPMAGLGDGSTVINTFDPPRPSPVDAANIHNLYMKKRLEEAGEEPRPIS